MARLVRVAARILSERAVLRPLSLARERDRVRVERPVGIAAPKLPSTAAQGRVSELWEAVDQKAPSPWGPEALEGEGWGDPPQADSIAGRPWWHRRRNSDTNWEGAVLSRGSTANPRKAFVWAPAVLIATAALLAACSEGAPKAVDAPATIAPAGTGTVVPGSSPTTVVPSGTVPSGLDGRIVLTRSNRLVVRDVASGEERTLVTAPGSDFMIDPAWSRDGAQIAYAQQITLIPGRSTDYGSDLYVIDAAGGEPRRLLEHNEPGSFYRYPSFSPDGRTVYFFRSRLDETQTQVFEGAALNLDTNVVEVLMKQAYGGEVSPDGKSLIYVDLTGGWQSLSLMDLATRKSRTLVSPDKDGLYFYYAPRFSPDGSRIVFAGSGDAGQVPVGSLPGRQGTVSDALVLSPDAALALGFAGAGALDGPPWDLYLVEVKGDSKLVRLTEVYDDQPFPAWSPDGARILYIGVTGLVAISPDQSTDPVKLDEGLLHAQMDWAWRGAS
jgi:Tol biopolymer transport system component